MKIILITYSLIMEYKLKAKIVPDEDQRIGSNILYAKNRHFIPYYFNFF